MTIYTFKMSASAGHILQGESIKAGLITTGNSLVKGRVFPPFPSQSHPLLLSFEVLRGPTTDLGSGIPQA
jgi:hypothetical protein